MRQGCVAIPEAAPCPEGRIFKKGLGRECRKSSETGRGWKWLRVVDVLLCR